MLVAVLAAATAFGVTKWQKEAKEHKEDVRFLEWIIDYESLEHFKELEKLRKKTEAVKAGHAEYYLDENNEKQWRWK